MPSVKRPRTPKEMKYPEFELNVHRILKISKSNKKIVRYKPKFDLITLLDKYNKKVSDSGRTLKYHLKVNDSHYRPIFIDPVNRKGKSLSIENLTEQQKTKKSMNAKLRNQKEIISNFRTLEKYASQLRNNKKKMDLHTTALFKILKEADVFKHANYKVYKENLEKELLGVVNKISDFNILGYDEFLRKLFHQFTHEYTVKCNRLITNPDFKKLRELIDWLRRLNPVLEKTVDYRAEKKVRSQLRIPFQEAEENNNLFKGLDI